MRALTLSRQALTYGLLGGVAALLAHEFGYSGAHTSAVDHSHIPVFATWLAAPAFLVSMRLLATLDRVRYARLLALQVLLLVSLEIGERVAQSVPLATVVSAPALLAVASAPVAAVLLFAPLGLGRVLVGSVGTGGFRVPRFDFGPVVSRTDVDRGRHDPRRTCARSPPAPRRSTEVNDMIGAFRCERSFEGRWRSSSYLPRAVGTTPS